MEFACTAPPRVPYCARGSILSRIFQHLSIGPRSRTLLISSIIACVSVVGSLPSLGRVPAPTDDYEKSWTEEQPSPLVLPHEVARLVVRLENQSLVAVRRQQQSQFAPRQKTQTICRLDFARNSQCLTLSVFAPDHLIELSGTPPPG